MNINIFGRQFAITKGPIVICAVLLLVILGIVGYFLSNYYQPFDEVSESTAIIMNDSPTIDKSEQTEAVPTETEMKIKVYVTGCVNKPGVVVLKKGQIIEDAIIAAGGFTIDADKDNINLAFVLNENVMLRIKPASEQVEPLSKQNKSVSQQANVGSVPNGNQKAGKDNLQINNVQQPQETTAIENSGVDIITESINTVVGEQKASNNAPAKVNINTADAKLLDTLRGVGEATAAAIIEYRNNNGPFKKIEDIMKITGIKQKSFEKIKDEICIE